MTGGGSGVSISSRHKGQREGKGWDLAGRGGAREVLVPTREMVMRLYAELRSCATLSRSDCSVPDAGGLCGSQTPGAPCHSMSYPSSLVSEHMAANAANLLLKTLSAWDFS